MQLYKMIKNQLGIVQKCFLTSILIQSSPATRLCTKLRSWSTFVQASLGLLFCKYDFFTFAGNCMWRANKYTWFSLSIFIHKVVSSQGRYTNLNCASLFSWQWPTNLQSVRKVQIWLYLVPEINSSRIMHEVHCMHWHRPKTNRVADLFMARYDAHFYFVT